MTSTDQDTDDLLALQARYAETYDGCEPEGFAAAFAADGTLVLPDGVSHTGHDALCDFAAAAAARSARTHHFMQNQRVHVTGNTATGTAHVTAVSRLGDSVRLLIIGRYQDAMIRTAEGWRFQERRIIALTPDDLPDPLLSS